MQLSDKVREPRRQHEPVPVDGKQGGLPVLDLLFLG
jgi:hypothetical protein